MINVNAADANRSFSKLLRQVAHQLSSWDALVLNVAAESGARLLLTEDLHPGLNWRGVRVVNPFSDEQDPLLTQLLN
ncbi:hypothetical protein [Vulcanococcus sp.]|jgi:predicted nucleic acid-binding protein|uniref:hypothetical protein n=1 Tax=Vulcanococcus sp. TaxID=2856995 RepID=UPI0037DA72B1